MLSYYVYLAKKRPIKPIDVERLTRKEISESEMLELRSMEGTDLLALMKFCGIRVYEGTPVIACTDDELKVAYVLWRSNGIKERKKTFAKWHQKFIRLQKEVIDFIRVGSIYK